MSTALYGYEIISKKGATLRLKLFATYRDSNTFGTDPRVAWKLLAHWVSTDDDVEASVDMLAGRYVRSVKVSSIKHAAVIEKTATGIRFERVDADEYPEAIYTIEVSDPKLLAPIEVGDSDDLYDRLDGGEEAPKGRVPPAKPARAKAKAKSSPELVPRTQQDFRALVVELVAASDGSSGRDVVPLLVRWSRELDDTVLFGFIEKLAPKQAAFAGQAAALVAIERAREGKQSAAESFLDRAEKILSTLRSDHDATDTLVPVVAARWRVGRTSEAEAGFARLDALAATTRRSSLGGLLQCGAHGGQWARVRELASKLAREPGTRDLDVATILALEDEAAFGACLEAWDRSGAWDKGFLQDEIRERLIARGEPHRYLMLLEKYPAARENNFATPALLAMTAREPARAADFARRILAAVDAPYASSDTAVAAKILAAQSKDEAEAWVEAYFAANDWPNSPLRKLPWLAALGRHDALAAILATWRPETRSPWDKSSDGSAIRDAMSLVDDRSVKLWLLDAYLDAFPEEKLARSTLEKLKAFGADERAAEGERARVANLSAELEVVKKAPPKDRYYDCLRIAIEAAEVGLHDLAFAACALPSKSSQESCAGRLMEAYAKLGDFSRAFAALGRIGAQSWWTPVLDAAQRVEGIMARAGLPVRTLEPCVQRVYTIGAGGDDPHLTP